MVASARFTVDPRDAARLRDVDPAVVDLVAQCLRVHGEVLDTTPPIEMSPTAPGFSLATASHHVAVRLSGGRTVTLEWFRVAGASPERKRPRTVVP